MNVRRTFGLALGLLVAGPVSAGQHLVAMPTDAAPVIDGHGDDAVWRNALSVTTIDPVANIEITLRAVYTRDEIYFLVQFPDPREDRDHKTLHWDPDQERYRSGPEREDTFVFKWNMEPGSVDLSLKAEKPYRADIWYWKSHRTDHAGHADDKIQTYSTLPSPQAKKLRSATGAPFYLTRSGDEGEAAYRNALVTAHVEDRIPKYSLNVPTGSRADVRAKGEWKDGVWTVEFRRKLDTGHADDIRLDPGKRYQFCTSRFEIAGRKPDPGIAEPLFGSGEVGEPVTLEFG